MRIFKDYMGAASEKQVATVSDIEVARIVENYTPERILEIVETTNKWDVFFHLSPARRNILEWYRFREGARVLEVDAANGALTGILCERCAHVTATVFSPYRAETIGKRYHDKENLDIYVGAIGAMKFKEKFDYIILINNLENVPVEKRGQYLRILDGMLKQDGILLCAVDNRYGMRYLCGARECHTGGAYDGLNGYPFKSNGWSFDRQELLDFLVKSGFSQMRMYYPLPDMYITQIVYSDAQLPSEDSYENLATAYWGYDTMRGNEDILYRDAINNRVFPFVAPCFFVECSHIELPDEQKTGILKEVSKQRHKNFQAKAEALERIQKNKVLTKPLGGLDQEALPLGKKDLDKLSEIRKVQIDILREFERICEKYNLAFWAFRGTLLGAVRHGGYIPWDDDVDVAMPRRDFERFKEVISAELKRPYFFQSSKTDKSFFWGSMCRIRNLDTTGIAEEEIGNAENGGIWIDILVLDNVFVDLRMQRRQLRKASFWTKMALIKTYGSADGATSEMQLNSFLIWLDRFLPRNLILAIVERAYRMCPDEKTNICSVFNRRWDMEGVTCYDKSDFLKSKEWDFENIKIPVPDEYDHILKKSIGKNYMHFPKVEYRIPKHNGIFDPKIPCWHFSNIWLKEASKSMIVIGETSLKEDFMNRYGSSGKYICIDDSLDEGEWDSYRENIIICAGEYEEYVERMEHNGIKKYYIYTGEIGGM